MERALTPYQAAALPHAGAVLVFAPHPDDEVFGCGGLLTLLANSGEHQVKVVLVSDGATQHAPARDEMAVTRLAESAAAARALGYPPPECMHWADRSLRFDEPLIDAVSAAIEACGAKLVVAPSTSEMHPDHRSLGLAVAEAARRLTRDFDVMFYEVGVPLHPNCLIDISTVKDLKQQAMQCFTSQLALQRYDRHIEALNQFRTYTLPAEVESAEAFYQISAAQLRADARAVLAPDYYRQRAIGLPMMPADVPLVSILIRSSDRDTLAQALDSAAQQTYAHLQLVVVNVTGRSHTPLPNVWGGRALRFVEPGRRLSRSDAANALLEVVSGEFALFLDDDDWLLPTHVQRLVATLQVRPSYIAAYADIECWTQEAGQWRTIRTYATDYERQRLLVENFLPLHAVLFRCAAASELRFDAGLDLFEDWDWWLRLSACGEFLRVPGVSAIYRIHESGGLGVAADPDLARYALAAMVERWQSAYRSEEHIQAIAYTRRTLRALAQCQYDFEALAAEHQAAKLSHDVRLREVGANYEVELQRQYNDGETRIAQLTAAYDMEIQRQGGEYEGRISQISGAYAAEILRLSEASRAIADHIQAEALRVQAEHEQRIAEICASYDAEHLRFAAEQAEFHRAAREAAHSAHLAAREADQSSHHAGFGQHIARYENSLSWRLTAPLRKILAFVRK